jgi:hypothetical protein
LIFAHLPVLVLALVALTRYAMNPLLMAVWRNVIANLAHPSRTATDLALA